jgi:hypothetical protein
MIGITVTPLNVGTHPPSTFSARDERDAAAALDRLVDMMRTQNINGNVVLDTDPVTRARLRAYLRFADQMRQLEGRFDPDFDFTQFLGPKVPPCP